MLLQTSKNINYYDTTKKVNYCLSEKAIDIAKKYVSRLDYTRPKISYIVQSIIEDVYTKVFKEIEEKGTFSFKPLNIEEIETRKVSLVLSSQTEKRIQRLIKIGYGFTARDVIERAILFQERFS